MNGHNGSALASTLGPAGTPHMRNSENGDSEKGDSVSAQNDQRSVSKFEGIFQTNAGFVEEKYEQFLKNPSAVDAEWQAYFEGFKGGFAAAIQAVSQFQFESGAFSEVGHAHPAPNLHVTPSPLNDLSLNSEAAVYQLTRAFQEYGHLRAHINPLSDTPPESPDILRAERHGLTHEAMSAMTAVGVHFGWAPMPIGEYIERLTRLFCGSVGIEIEHVMTDHERSWLDSRLNRILIKPEEKTRKSIYEDLARADALEKTIATKYIGQKRFSIEGAEAQNAAVESFIDHAAAQGATEFCLAMAHRGRLNVLVNIVQKPLKKLFAEFDGRKDETSFGDGDVKYHCGWEVNRTSRSGHPITVSLSFNPSHLEFIDAVVMGETRAIQDIRHGSNNKTAVPIILHGDAAFAGQGVVYESMQMVGITGQTVGGCLHIVANNQVGFTTNPSDSRSSRYCSDIGKAFGAPIFHVNANDLDALHQVMCLAAEYRQNFARDVIIDIVCFRRHGHNESDEPSFTQPAMYKTIKSKACAYEDYLKILVNEDPSKYAEAELADLYQKLRNEMNAVFDESQKNPEKIDVFPPTRRNDGFVHASEADILRPVATAVQKETLLQLGHAVLTLPEGFTANPKLERIIVAERKEMLEGHKLTDWGMGELLAYASLLAEGHGVRICGQDAGRGTFSHRHAVLVDANDERRFLGLKNVAKGNTKVEIIDSLLSETAALGYEYGYATRNLDALTIWEAQFGDFCNGAQVIIDQFIVSGESKWGQMSGLVLLLPHGYEGQGPEHSSGRLERFLQLSAEGNIQVCVLTRASQLFHALRRQVKRNFRKPLIIMSPKSFLRNPRASVTLEALANSGFEEILIDDRNLKNDEVERIILCSGKIALDAFAHADSVSNDDKETAICNKTAFIRLEQLYPLHVEKLTQAIAMYPKAKSIFWAQEEPQNMGAYTSIHADLEDAVKGFKFKGGIKYIGRSKRASPAVGVSKVHAKEFAGLMNALFHATDVTLL